MLRNNLTTLAVDCNDTVNNSDWFANLYQLENMENLHIYSSGVLSIGDSICKHFKHLRRLTISCDSMVIFPKDLRCLENLIELSVKRGFTYEINTMPSYLPLSLKKLTLNIEIAELPQNLTALEHLMYLDISRCNTPPFPSDFNFSKLNYFKANESQFLEKKWLEIEKETTVLRVTDHSSYREDRPLGKRN